MLVELAVSSSFLLIASGSSVCLLVKHSYDVYEKLLPRYVYASMGLGFILLQSANVFYCGIIKGVYNPDPEKLLEIRSYDVYKTPLWCRLINSFYYENGVPALISALYFHYHHKILGNVIIGALGLAKGVQLLIDLIYPEESVTNVPQDEPATLKRIAEVVYVFEPLGWILAGGVFSWTMGNYYGALSFLPYSFTMYGLRPEEYYEEPTIRRVIHHYMMLGHILLMTDALRQQD